MRDSFFEKRLDKFLFLWYNVCIVEGYRQVGKAQDFDSCIRWFESSYPCHRVSLPLAQD